MKSTQEYNLDVYPTKILKNLPYVPKKTCCHGHFGVLPKPKFRQGCHGSRGLPNWSKWHSRIYSHRWMMEVLMQWEKVYPHKKLAILGENTFQREVLWSIRQAMLHITCLLKFWIRHMGEMTVTYIFFRQIFTIFLRFLKPFLQLLFMVSALGQNDCYNRYILAFLERLLRVTADLIKMVQ